MKSHPTLDIDLLRAFVAVTDAMSFTAAGGIVGATQSAMSLRIRKLEDRLGRRLMDRTPRSLALTPFGETFLDSARRVLRAHDESVMSALARDDRRPFSLAVSDHAAGADLPAVLADLHRRRPDVQFLVTVGASLELYRSFERGDVDAFVGRADGGRRADGRIASHALYPDQLVWTSAPGFEWLSPDPLPLVSLAAPCGIRSIAAAALTGTGQAWREAFTGTGVAAVRAAVSAGLGIACLGAGNVPADCVALAEGHGLPPLPALEFMLHHRPASDADLAVGADVAAAFRAGRQGRSSFPPLTSGRADRS